jgi:hypothetical protein
MLALCGRSERGRARAYHLTDVLARSPAIANTASLRLAVQEMRSFLDERMLPFMYLEVAEIDMMSVGDGVGVRLAAEQHVRTAHELGTWVDQLSLESVSLAMNPGGVLQNVFDQDGKFDQMRGKSPPRQPIGLGFWSDVLYYSPLNAAQWAARDAR